VTDAKFVVQLDAIHDNNQHKHWMDGPYLFLNQWRDWDVMESTTLITSTLWCC